MDVFLENDFLTVGIRDKGAELKSVKNKKTRLEYMWGGDPVFWGKTSPILFPIVGTLKNDTYLFNGKSYTLPRHGFARDSTFQLAEQQKDRAIFSLVSTATSRKNYPFDFELQVVYTLVDDNLEVTYGVRNMGYEAMWFSIGGHPAFKVPIVEGSMYDDHYLEFSEKENLARWPISVQGLIGEAPVPLLTNSGILKLNRDLFKEDALVFKNLKSKKVSIKSVAHHHGLEFSFEGFPYLGIWAAKNADFVCIEPWCGIADSVLHDQQLEAKEGVVKISSGESWRRTWKVKFY